MQFRTAYQVKKQNPSVSYKDSLFFIGSCFSVHLADLLKEQNFKVQSNPYGILFNPFSIFGALQEIVNKKQYQKADLMAHDNVFHSFNHHSSFSNVQEKNVLDAINLHIERAHQFIQNTKYLIITFGTAWAFTHQNKVVANCHKMPQKNFEKILLKQEKILKEWQITKYKLLELNPDLQFIFTLSPVRHLKDGFIENSVSKAILRSSIYEITSSEKDCFYFPAYEIMMDDLRDYRFYKSDYLHPTEEAIQYIWTVFKETHFDDKTMEYTYLMQQLNAAKNHKIMNEHSESFEKHAKHIESLQAKIKKLC